MKLLLPLLLIFFLSTPCFATNYKTKHNPFSHKLDYVIKDGVSGPSAGTSTDNAIARWDGTDGDTLQDSSVFIDDDGNVGIGTATPGYHLTINEATPAANEVLFAVQNNGTDKCTIDEDGDIVATSIGSRAGFVLNLNSAGTTVATITSSGISLPNACSLGFSQFRTVDAQIKFLGTMPSDVTPWNLEIVGIRGYAVGDKNGGHIEIDGGAKNAGGLDGNVVLGSNAGGVGIATATVPHGGIGAAKFAVEGTDQNVAGPHAQFTTDATDYPICQMLHWQHDNAYLTWDAYFDGAWKSSDAGSNFGIVKGGVTADTLRIQYDSGVALGDAVTWNDAVSCDSTGRVTIHNGAFVSGLTDVTSADADYMLIWDATDSALKKCDMAEVRGGTVSVTRCVSLPIHSAKISGALVTDGDATQGASIDAGDGNWRLLFDDTTDEAAVWQFRFPADYTSDPIAKIGYTMASGTSNKVEFEVGVMAVTDGDAADIGTASFDTLNVGSATVPGTAGYLDEISVTLSNADSVAAGDLCFIYLSTDSDDGTNDNATGDREVVYVDLVYSAATTTANQWMNLPMQSAKLTGAFVTAPAAIDAGDGNWRLLFDASSTESALWQFRMPANYASALTAKLGYTMAAATSNKVDLEVEVMAVSDGDSADINTASFAAVNEVSGGTTVPGTAGYLDEISITLSNADNVAAGDLVYIRVNRDHDDSDDTATGDLELAYLQLTYTGT